MKNLTVLSFDMRCEKCKKVALQSVTKIEGIDRLEIDMNRQTLAILGDADPVAIANKIRKKFPCAKLVTAKVIEDESKGLAFKISEKMIDSLSPPAKKPPPMEKPSKAQGQSPNKQKEGSKAKVVASTKPAPSSDPKKQAEKKVQWEDQNASQPPPKVEKPKETSVEEKQSAANENVSVKTACGNDNGNVASMSCVHHHHPPQTTCCYHECPPPSYAPPLETVRHIYRYPYLGNTHQPQDWYLRDLSPEDQDQSSCTVS